MEHYIVSARKYRPSTFNTVIGQKSLTAALKHAVATDRLAHAYLFCGSRGVGKTSCARIFAKTINCEHRTEQGEACNECTSCRAFNDGTSFNIIELDAASHNGIDDIKNLNEQVMVPPTEGRYRVFIIDEVHMLSAAAFNAFLKTLEEPPEYVIFILATTEKHKIIPTILSRCQIYDFNRITIQDMVEHLTYVASQEGVTVEPQALNVIARKADGAMRDALSIFDQVAASTMGNVNYQSTIANLNILDNTYYGRLVEAFLTNDVPTALLIYQEIRDKGFDSQFFINGLGQYMRDLMVAMNPQTINLLEASDDERQRMAAVASRCRPQMLYTAMDLCNEADLNFRAATNKQLLIELTLVKLCQITAPREPAQQQQGLKPVTPANNTSGDTTGRGRPSPQSAAPQPSPSSTGFQPVNPQPSPSSTGFQPVNQQSVNQQPVNQHAVSQQPVSQHAVNPRPVTPPPGIPQPQAPQPAVRQPQQPTTRPQVGSMPKFSIKGTDRSSETKEPEPEPDAGPRRRGAYTDEQLQGAWNEYIDAHPTERILINTMRSARPERAGQDSYTITVDGDIQVQTVNESKAEILALLHERLGNDYVDFTIKLREGQAAPSTWTHREVLNHMAQHHAPLQDMISQLGLNL